MNYPYVCTRIRARKGRLFGREEYLKMAEMKLDELMEFLSKSTYRYAMNELREIKGIEKIHLAAMLGYAMEAMEIRKMMSKDLQEALSPIFMELDMENLLAIIRGKIAGIGKKEMRYLLLPAPRLKPRLLLDMYELEIKDILVSFSSHPLLRGIKIGEKINVKDVEEQIFFNYIASLEVMKRLKEIKNYVVFVMRAIDAINLMKAKLHGGEPKILTKEWEKMKDAGFEEIIGKAQEIFGFGRNPAEMETKIEQEVLKKALLLMRLNPISAAPIVGYLKAKEAESRNIRIIAAGIAEGMEKERILEALVYESRGGG